MFPGRACLVKPTSGNTALTHERLQSPGEGAEAAARPGSSVKSGAGRPRWVLNVGEGAGFAGVLAKAVHTPGVPRGSVAAG